MTDCLSWILDGQLKKYTPALCTDKRIHKDLKNPEGALLADAYDMFTLDATIIATGLGQLLDEGRIDSSAKPYIRVALTRQLHPEVVRSERHAQILKSALRVLEKA